MLSKTLKEKLSDLEKLGKFLKNKEFIEIKIGFFGGRKFIIQEDGKTRVFKLVDLLEHAKKLAEKEVHRAPSSTNRWLQHRWVKRKNLEDEQAEATQEEISGELQQHLEAIDQMGEKLQQKTLNKMGRVKRLIVAAMAFQGHKSQEKITRALHQIYLMGQEKKS